MNAARLRELSDLLVEVEAKFQLQAIMQQMVNELNQLIANSNQPQFQTQYAQSFIRFRSTWAEMTRRFSPAQAKLLNEIGATKFFLADVPSHIEAVALANNITPAVIRDQIEQVRSGREQYLTTITELRDRLKRIGIEPYALEPDSAEIGLLLPRESFGNELGGLINELKTLNRIIRAFSEITFGHAEPVELHQISTSDPVFFLGLAPQTIALLAGAVSWALKTWKDVEDIRKVRTETQKLKTFTPEEVDGIFGKKIQAQIDMAIDEKVKELITVNEQAGRHHEQQIDLTWALESILGRVERGLTVEVRFIPPPAPKSGEVPSPDVAAFEALKELAPQLTFPAPDPTPVLRLPAPEPPSDRLAQTSPTSRAAS